jgi:hypothetical protein
MTQQNAWHRFFYKNIAGTPAKLLDDLEDFYDNQSHPKAKGMAKLVRGFKAKFL